MLFSRKAAVDPPTKNPPTIGRNGVNLSAGVLSFDNNKIRLSDVIIASINRDTVPGDGIGGSVLFKTREFEPNRGVVQKIYKGTFDEGAIDFVASLADRIREYGGTVKNHKLSDAAFRRAFF